MSHIKKILLDQLKYVSESVELIDEIDPIENYIFNTDYHSMKLNLTLIGKEYEHDITLPQIIRKEKKTK